MSIWGILFLLVAVIQFVFEKYKEQVKNNEQSLEKETAVEEIDSEKFSAVNTKSVSERKVLKDREDEIIGSNLSPKKDKLVQDLIFAEILSKPKSKL